MEMYSEISLVHQTLRNCMPPGPIPPNLYPEICFPIISSLPMVSFQKLIDDSVKVKIGDEVSIWFPYVSDEKLPETSDGIELGIVDRQRVFAALHLTGLVSGKM